MFRALSKVATSTAKLSWVLAGLAGLVGAAAFLHSAGYFVTFMTGNTERLVLGYFAGKPGLAVAAVLLLSSFVLGVLAASVGRRRWWGARPYAVTTLTTLCLGFAAVIDIIWSGMSSEDVLLGPLLLVAFGIGALNTVFQRDGEVSIPVSYMTGTVVKLGQGIERHISGGDATEWLGYFLLYMSFGVGAAIGGVLGLLIGGAPMLAVACLIAAVVTIYTMSHAEKYGDA
ncbi:YoaK family protein [Nocardia brasiliensis]